MTLAKQILTELREIRVALHSNRIDYVFTGGACEILALKNPRDLKPLRERFMKSGVDYAKRGRDFIYYKKSLYPLRAKLDKGDIII